MDPYIWMYLGGANEPHQHLPCDLMAMKPAGRWLGLDAIAVAVALLIAALVRMHAPAGHAAGTVRQSSAANSVTVSNGM